MGLVQRRFKLRVRGKIQRYSTKPTYNTSPEADKVEGWNNNYIIQGEESFATKINSHPSSEADQGESKKAR
jgi:hypothetical protein